jgi:hypothetical protein
MKRRVAIVLASVAMILVSLVSSPASANNGTWSFGILRHYVWHHYAWHHRSCSCALGRFNRYHTPAQDYTAIGVGPGYSTAAYSTDGYAHHYRD